MLRYESESGNRIFLSGLVSRITTAGETDIPDASFENLIHHFHEGLVGAVSIATEAYWLLIGSAFVHELGCFHDALELSAEFEFGVICATDGDATVFLDVDDDFISNTSGLRAFRRSWDGDLAVFFLLGNLVGHEEEGEQEEDDIDHWRQLESDGFGIDITNFHESLEMAFKINAFPQEGGCWRSLLERGGSLVREAEQEQWTFAQLRVREGEFPRLRVRQGVS